jgi:predicted dinucleotide-binding enzyme
LKTDGPYPPPMTHKDRNARKTGWTKQGRRGVSPSQLRRFPHRDPPRVMFLSGDKQAKLVVAQLIRDAGFDPVDLGGIDDSRLQDPGSALWTYTLTHDEATRSLRG